MSNDEKYNAIFDLLANAQERLDVASLHAEIRKQIDSGDKAFGKFLDLLQSLQEIVPKEKQRYRVAIKVLSTTAGLNRQNVLDSTDNQFEELKILEKVALSAMSGFRDELEAMESRSKAIKEEMARLREQIAELQKEEQRLLGNMAAREAAMKTVEEKIKKVFTDIVVEITEVRDKIEQFSADKASPEPAVPPEPATPPEPVESVTHDKAREDFEIKPKMEESSAKQLSTGPITPPRPVEINSPEDGRETEEDSGPQEAKRECPICGEPMHLHDDEARWKCYQCGREEPHENDSAIKAAAEGNEISETSLQEKKWLKECPMCGGRMNLHEDQGIWMCYSCGHEELGTSDLKNTSKSAAAPETASPLEPAPEAEPATVPKPAVAVSHAAHHKPSPVSHARSGKQRSPRKKTCPVCRKQMNMHEEENTWKCPYCDYQRREF